MLQGTGALAQLHPLITLCIETKLKIHSLLKYGHYTNGPGRHSRLFSQRWPSLSGKIPLMWSTNKPNGQRFALSHSAMSGRLCPTLSTRRRNTTKIHRKQMSNHKILGVDIMDRSMLRCFRIRRRAITRNAPLAKTSTPGFCRDNCRCKNLPSY